MLTGPACGSVCLRWSIHASSFHSWSDSMTMEPVAGGISWERSIGSAFIFHSWFALSSSYL